MVRSLQVPPRVLRAQLLWNKAKGRTMPLPGRSSEVGGKPGAFPSGLHAQGHLSALRLTAEHKRSQKQLTWLKALDGHEASTPQAALWFVPQIRLCPTP